MDERSAGPERLSHPGERIGWIDAARGIGILLVVFGHGLVPPAVARQLYSFHVPLFFLLSGLVAQPDRWPSFGAFARRRARTLLVPYAAFFVVLYAYFLTVGVRFGDVAGEDRVVPLVGFLLSSSPFLTSLFRPMWFLPCLLVVELLFHGLHRLLGRRWWLGMLACVVLGWLTSLFLPVRLPWSLDTALTAVGFYGVGFALRPLAARAQELHLGWRLLAVLAFAALNGFAVALNGGVSLLGNSYGPHITLFWLGALAGIGASLLVARFLVGSRVLRSIGRNSLVLFVFHPVALGLLRAALAFLFDVRAVSLRGSVAWALVLTVASVAALAPLSCLINRAAPALLGRRRPPRHP